MATLTPVELAALDFLIEAKKADMLPASFITAIANVANKVANVADKAVNVVGNVAQVATKAVQVAQVATQVAEVATAEAGGAEAVVGSQALGGSAQEDDALGKAFTLELLMALRKDALAQSKA